MTTLIFPAYDEKEYHTKLIAAIKGAQSAGDQSGVTSANWTGSVEANTTLEFPGTHRRAITGNTTLVTLPTPASGITGTLSLKLIQPSTGPGTYTITWPTQVVNSATVPLINWGYGNPIPQIPTRLGGYILVHIFWDGIEWSGALQGEY